MPCGTRVIHTTLCLIKTKKKELTLKLEIPEFWKWAKTTPDKYSQNRGLGEWETEYPNWDELKTAIDQSILELNKTNKVSTAELLIQGLAIDNESGLTLDNIENDLDDKNKFLEQIINPNQPQAKWQIAELLRNIQIENATQYLKRLAKEKDKYVIRRTLLSL